MKNAAWAIRHVDLSGVVAPLEVADGRGYYLVFWYDELPLGDCYVRAEELPMSSATLLNLASSIAVDAVGTRLFGASFSSAMPPGSISDATAPTLNAVEIAQLSRPLEASLAQAEEVGKEQRRETISIVICTRDRPEYLEQCLLSLRTLDEKAAEIIVVDNAPTTDQTRKLASGCPGVRYVHEPRPGLDVARNRAVRESTGSIVAFVDDDVRIHPCWLRRIRNSFLDSRVQAVTGLVLPQLLETESQILFETEWTFNRGFSRKVFGSAFFASTRDRGVPVWDIGAGANMAFRRSAFARFGYFDERLDVGAAGCSGDSEYWFRILAEGGVCVYEPGAVVFHAHRPTMEGLEHQLFNYIRGHVAALLIQHQKYRCRGDIRRLLITLPHHYARMFGRRLLGKADSQSTNLIVQCRGYLSGIAFFLRHRSIPADALAASATQVTAPASTHAQHSTA